jgi:hypothetical protein
VSPKIREIAWKAQSRLTARYRAFVARGKILDASLAPWPGPPSLSGIAHDNPLT